MRIVDRKLALAYDFFRRNAGGWVGHSAETAINLARAERESKDRRWHCAWIDDDDPDLSFMSPRERKAVREVLVCVLLDDEGAVLESCGGIIDPSNDYARVMEAELASAAVHYLRQREAADRSAGTFQAL